jgi:hypothetical protein
LQVLQTDETFGAEELSPTTEEKLMTRQLESIQIHSKVSSSQL